MIVSFDYSLSCPAMCVSFSGKSFLNQNFYYLTSVKKNAVTLKVNGVTIDGTYHKDYTTEQERYNNIAEHFVNILDQQIVFKHTPVFIEDYSFGSKGKVFHIAENTGVLKHKIWSRGNPITTVPPTVLKKFATGKGNADKAMMYEAFRKENGDVLISFRENKKDVGSPLSDIVDAYFLAQYGRSKE